MLPGTGERHTVLALPYSLDRDHDGVRESVALVMEPDLAVPTSASVALGVEQSWSSSSSVRVVPDPAEWDRISGRVAGIARAVVDRPTRAALARRVGIDPASATPAEVDQLVLQAAQLAVWQLSSGVTAVPDPATPDDAGRVATLAAVSARLVQDAIVTTPGPVDVYRVTAPGGATASSATLRITGGRSLVAAAAAATPTLVVARAQGAATPPRAAQPVPAQAPAAPAAPAAPVPAAPARPAAAPKPADRPAISGPNAPAPAAAPAKAPSTDVSSCVALGRTDVAEADADYRTPLDLDRDGIACESNGQDGPVARGGTAPSPAPVVVNGPTVTSSQPVTSNGSPTCAQLGRRNVLAADPQYHPGLDSDHDGIGCEWGKDPGTPLNPGHQLAQTGFDAPQLSALALGTIGLGGLLMRLGRRRARP
ncbi:excalibur calcium-binding domain-containing protein [Arsenicicoccus sp. oral taxon 190]|uniref:excalibur calcium-binding domain-containing protein n=1 Tax=Arsenicicoccus sp. oral taxon 190 TaxID=1658671 RepID=UPI0012E2B78B|nr:excalibur calcium-binding domain-containing protein [Arsenicicoccus sp. oral taxon 190]